MEGIKGSGLGDTPPTPLQDGRQGTIYRSKRVGCERVSREIQMPDLAGLIESARHGEEPRGSRESLGKKLTGSRTDWPDEAEVQLSSKKLTDRQLTAQSDGGGACGV